ncbi:hypothetical protein N9997_01545 [Synechococcus sp. AH-603-L18]|nr:hypothetical protein [Synechococcus sp. AH-603-L18]MDB4338007.1 hypothetical protein [Synechococcus sp. AH-603-L18]
MKIKQAINIASAGFIAAFVLSYPGGFEWLSKDVQQCFSSEGHICRVWLFGNRAVLDPARYIDAIWNSGVIPGKPLVSPSDVIRRPVTSPEVVPPVQSDPITRQNCSRYLTATECGQRF